MKKFFAAVLALLLAIGLVPLTQATQTATGDDGTTNRDFVIPVTHVKTVPVGYTAVRTAQELDAVRKNLGGKYILMADIDLANGGNWLPIGDGDTEPFHGTLDGNGYVIRNMTVNMSAPNAFTESRYAGLFGACRGAAIRNLGIAAGQVSASSDDLRGGVYAGGFVGVAYGGSQAVPTRIENSCYTGSVRAIATNRGIQTYAGGLIGGFYDDSFAAIENSYHAGGVNAVSVDISGAGGLIGGSSGPRTFARIKNSSNTGDVYAFSGVQAADFSANSYAGGLVAAVISADISNSSNAGSVCAQAQAQYVFAGGLVGRVFSVKLAGGSNRGSVNASGESAAAGGLIASLASEKDVSVVVGGTVYKAIENSCSSAAVSAAAKAGSALSGGLLGRTAIAAAIKNSYSLGQINAVTQTGETCAGALLGRVAEGIDNMRLTNCFYPQGGQPATGDGSSGKNSKNVLALTDSQMRRQDSYTEFDFQTVWQMGALGYPELPALRALHAHTYGSWKTTQAAACAAEGISARTCTDCGTGETKTIPKLTTHKAGAWKTVTAAATTKAGKAEKRCSVCKLVLESKVLPANPNIKLNKSSVTLGKKEPYPLTATTDVKTAVTWSSSNTSVAAVDKNGTITAKAAGNATITAKTAGGKTAKCAVSVKAEPTSITLNKTSITLGKKESVPLTAKLNSGAVSHKKTWTSGNPKVATVDAKGNVTAVGIGKTTITVKTFNDKTAKCTVTVKPAPDYMDLSRTSVTLGKGETVALTAAPNAGAASLQRSWISGNPKVATVDAKGKVTAVGIGKTTITVKAFNNQAETCVVTVKAAPTSVKLSRSTRTIEKGSSGKLTATLNPSGAASLKKTWSSDNPKVVKVDANGRITAIGVGTANISFKTFNNKTKTCKVTVIR